jgi:hypothetical protein
MRLKDHIGDVAERLLGGPRNIYKKQAEVDTYRDALHNSEYRLKVREAEIANEVYLDNKDGKVIYTNEAARKDETTIRLAQDEIYQKLVKDRYEAWAILKGAERELDLLVNEFKGARAAALLIYSLTSE